MTYADVAFDVGQRDGQHGREDDERRQNAASSARRREAGLVGDVRQRGVDHVGDVRQRDIDHVGDARQRGVDHVRDVRQRGVGRRRPSADAGRQRHGHDDGRGDEVDDAQVDDEEAGELYAQRRTADDRDDHGQVDRARPGCLRWRPPSTTTLRQRRLHVLSLPTTSLH